MVNPYNPGAGTQPAFLAGRDNVLTKMNGYLEDTLSGKTGRPVTFYGLRGVGKTVLLREIEKRALHLGFICDMIEVSENDNFKLVITSRIRKILFEIDRIAKTKDQVKKVFGYLKALSYTFPDGGSISLDMDAIRGNTDSGIFQNDLTEMMVSLGELAQSEGRFICILIDEIQYLKNDDLEAVIASLHKINQRNLPIVFIGAGLPSIHQLMGVTKSYTERMFDFIPIDSLNRDEADRAISNPAIEQNVSFSDEALELIYSTTQGYPYFIQEFGFIIWDNKTNNKIDISQVMDSIQYLWDKLDNGFFKSRWDRATEQEKKFMIAMSTSHKGPYKISVIPKRMGKMRTADVSLIRESLIGKGLIYSVGHGLLDFTVPQFPLFIERVVNKMNKPE